MGDSNKKPLLAARVPRDIEERFEEFREEKELSKSDALRRIIQTGLDETEAQQREHREEARAVTAEQWCREKIHSWTGIAVLSAVGFVLLFIVFTANHFGFALLPDWPFSLAMVGFLGSFGIFGGGAVAAWFALRTGFARKRSVPNARGYR